MKWVVFGLFVSLSLLAAEHDKNISATRPNDYDQITDKVTPEAFPDFSLIGRLQALAELGITHFPLSNGTEKEPGVLDLFDLADVRYGKRIQREHGFRMGFENNLGKVFPFDALIPIGDLIQFLESREGLPAGMGSIDNGVVQKNLTPKQKAELERFLPRSHADIGHSYRRAFEGGWTPNDTGTWLKQANKVVLLFPIEDFPVKDPSLWWNAADWIGAQNVLSMLKNSGLPPEALNRILWVDHGNRIEDADAGNRMMALAKKYSEGARANVDSHIARFNLKEEDPYASPAYFSLGYWSPHEVFDLETVLNRPETALARGLRNSSAQRSLALGEFLSAVPENDLKAVVKTLAKAKGIAPEIKRYAEYLELDEEGRAEYPGSFFDTAHASYKERRKEREARNRELIAKIDAALKLPAKSAKKNVQVTLNQSEELLNWRKEIAGATWPFDEISLALRVKDYDSAARIAMGLSEVYKGQRVLPIKPRFAGKHDEVKMLALGNTLASTTEALRAFAATPQPDRVYELVSGFHNAKVAYLGEISKSLLEVKPPDFVLSAFNAPGRVGATKVRGGILVSPPKNFEGNTEARVPKIPDRLAFPAQGSDRYYVPNN